MSRLGTEVKALRCRACAAGPALLSCAAAERERALHLIDFTDFLAYSKLKTKI